MPDNEKEILKALDFVPRVCEFCAQDASTALYVECGGCGLRSATMGMCVTCVVTLYRVVLSGGYFTCSECPHVTSIGGFRFEQLEE